MPLEIKYKEPTDRPIAEVQYTDSNGNQVTLWRCDKGFVRTRISDRAFFRPADFKEWAAAIYKFSQEI